MPNDLVEINDLIISGIARDKEHAIMILDSIEEKKRRADMYIFYTNYAVAREFYGEFLVDEMAYNYSNIRVAKTFSGLMGNKAYKSPPATLAIGRIKEFVSRKNEDQDDSKRVATLVAFVRNFSIAGKSGIFFSPHSQAEVHKRGNTTIDEREYLFRVEFRPVRDDFILGMFSSWGKLHISEHVTLILQMPRARILSK